MGRGRAPCCDKSKVKKGPWSPAEDLRLTTFIQKHGHSNWRALPKQAGLLRCGKSCRLRWINYLRPDVKRGNFTPEEEQTIINLHNSIGNKWSKIASYLPGRTDNEIKNVWNTHLKKRLNQSKKSAADCHENEDKDSKTNYSASPSSTSSSITSSDDQNTDKAICDQGVDQESDLKKLSEKPEFDLKAVSTHPSDDHNEAKDTDSPTSSYASNFSISRGDKSGIINPEDSPDNGKFEIPLESDIDFWDLLDSLDPLQPDKTDDEKNNQGSNLSDPGEKFDTDQIECSNWLRFLENELGLTSDVDNQPNDDNLIPTNPHYEGMDLEQEIGPGLDYFPIWPSSPQNLGI